MTVEYINYFRSLAIKNKKIKHVAAAESDHHTHLGERRFTLFTMDEIAKSVKSAMWEGPCLHLHLYDWNTPGSVESEIKQHFAGGFLVTRKVAKNDISGQVGAYSICEQIVEELLAKMKYDEEMARLNEDCLFPFRNIFWNEIQVNAAGPLFDNRYGWWVEFGFMKKSNGTINNSLANNAFD